MRFFITRPDEKRQPESVVNTFIPITGDILLYRHVDAKGPFHPENGKWGGMDKLLYGSFVFGKYSCYGALISELLK
jgi:hypothetical protein